MTFLSNAAAMNGQTYNSNRLLLTALLPFIAANLCYVVSSYGGYIPWCLTYIDGCTSISSTGRHGISYVLFKAAMLPHAALLWIFWGLEVLPGASMTMPSKARAFGRLGAVFLVIYVIFLGADTPIYALMRRYGVFVFFIGTFVAMSMVSWRWWQTPGERERARSFGVVCGLMLMLGLAEIPLGKFALAHNQAENIIEWNFSVLMQLWFLLFWWHGRLARRA